MGLPVASLVGQFKQHRIVDIQSGQRVQGRRGHYNYKNHRGA